MSTVVKVVNRISGIDMPSTPRWNCASIVDIHGARSTNCMAAVPVWKLVHNGMLKPKVRTLTLKESHFAAANRLPSPSTTNPPMMGSQINIASR